MLLLKGIVSGRLWIRWNGQVDILSKYFPLSQYYFYFVFYTCLIVFGFSRKLFGIYGVNFNDPKRPRTKKPSFEFFRKLFTTRALPPVECE